MAIPILHPPRLTGTLLCAALLFAPGAATTQGGWEAPDPATDVLMTVSGGISMGAYQGGFNWALVAHMKRDPRLRLRGVGGASAGNINALLTALEYCQSRQRKPGESLFWNVWVPTGLEDLLPPFDRARAEARRAAVREQLRGVVDNGAGEDPWDDPTDGVLSRAFFHARQLQVLKTALAEDGWERCAGVEIPVGITLTSLIPKRVALDAQEQLWATTIRVASAFTVRFPDGPTFGQLPLALREAPGVGVLLALPSDTDGAVSTLDVFKLLEASSAFPVAFGPRALRYYDPGALGDGGACPQNVPGRCNQPERELFIDGGVFDNNPVDLIWALTHPGAVSDPRPVRLVYIDPDTYRQPLEGTRIAAGSPPPTGGIDVLLRLAESAVPAARQYELQSLQRVIQRYDPDIGEALRITSRALPIYGDHAGAFAAFFGRPLREHDFYIGAWDGLRFVASEFVCQERAELAQRRCIVDRLREEVEGRHGFPVDPAGQLLWRAMFVAEFGDAVRPPGLNDRPSAADSVLLDLFAQNLSLLERGADGDCTALAPLHASLCATGMERALRGLSERTRAQVRAWAEEDACRSEDGFLGQGCRAEPSFVRLLEDPGHYTERLTEDVLERVRLVELSSRQRGEPGREWQVRLGQMVYRSTADRSKRLLFEMDPSTIPDRDQRPLVRLLHYGMPYYWMSALLDDGSELGWRPRFHLERGWVLDGTLGLILWRGWEPRLALGIGPSYKAAPWATLNASLLRVSSTRPWRDEGEQWGMEASMRVLTDKLSLSVRWLPDNRTQLLGGDDVGFYVGLSDLNGLVYMLAGGVF
jgi:predicted acylesterase/phospholipase RssA